MRYAAQLQFSINQKRQIKAEDDTQTRSEKFGMRLKRLNIVSASRYRSMTEFAVQPRVHIATRTRAAAIQFKIDTP